MTLVIVVYGTEFVVVGSDSRGTSRDEYDNRVEMNIYRKIVRFNDRVALLIHGEATAAMYLIDELRKSGNTNRLGVTEVGKRLWKLGNAQMAAAPIGTWNKLPQFGILVAGLDRGKGGHPVPRCFGITSVDSFWPHSYDQFAMKGKTMIANYVFAKEYEEGMSVDSLTRLVAQAIYDTMNVDGDVGGDINLLIIDSEGMREVPKDDVPQLIRPWGRPLAYLKSETGS
jgi:20S proteasome alpha/beta subunit